MSLKLNGEKGFTLPEILVVLVLSGLFSGLILFFGFSFWRYGYLLEADLDTLVTRLNAGDFLRESFSSSSGLVIQNGIPDPNPNNPDPADATNSYWEPIHAVPGNKPIGAPGSTTPLVYYKRFSVNTSGAVVMNGSQPFEDEYILYLNGTTKELLVRTLANPNATANRLKTSCSPASSTPSCPEDKVIAGDISSVDLRYFSRSGNLIDHTSLFDTTTNTYVGPDFTSVEVIEFNIHLAKKPIFQKTNATLNDTVIRIALRNT